MTEDRRRRISLSKRRSPPTRSHSPAGRRPLSKQLPEPVPDTEKDSLHWWMRIPSSYTPGRWGALPQAPDTEDDYDYTKPDFPLWWASVRFDDLIQMARAKGPAMWRVYATLADGSWQMFLRERAEIKDRLENTDWSQVPAPELMVFLEGATAIRMGIDALPREYASLSFSERSFLYLRALILWGTLRGGPFSLRPALEAVRLSEGAPYAIREIFRRGSKHVGRYMVFLLMSQGDSPRVVKALEGLRKTMYRHLPRGTVKRLRQEHGASAGTFADLNQEMDVQAFTTGVKRWGRHGPRGLILRWLAGKLNIAPRAIANDLQDADRTRMRRLSKEIVSDDPVETVRRQRSRGGIHRPDEEEILVDIVEERSRQAAKVLEYVEPFLAQHPRYRRGIEALLSDEPLAALAKQHSVTPKTLIDWKNRAVAALQRWIQEENQ